MSAYARSTAGDRGIARQREPLDQQGQLYRALNTWWVASRPRRHLKFGTWVPIIAAQGLSTSLPAQAGARA